MCRVLRGLRLVAMLAMVLAALASSSTKSTKKQSDPNDNKGLTPFFLQDPSDQTCLGPKGFTLCDENALWLLTRRVGKSTYSLVHFLNPEQSICLQQKKSFFGLLNSDQLSLGSCNAANAKSWKWDFLDHTSVKISTNGQCIARGKIGFKNIASLTPCSKGDYLALTYHATAVHENGFFLKASDGKCFDGSQFRTCSASSSKMLFGMGLKYVWGQPKKYLFHFAPSERSNCIVARGNKVEMDKCSSPQALTWIVYNGQLSYQHGKQCVVRTADDRAMLTKCSQGNEHISLEVPSLYSNEQLADFLNSDQLELDEQPALKQSRSARDLLR